jgi:3-hydroxyisobutyrate dehydrogenase-like beta-hydroxyacid dehydrogenase
MPVVVGFAGLGAMGSRMARNIGRAKFPLVLYNRTHSKAEDLAGELHAQVARAPSELGSRCDIILTMVSDANALRDLYFGDAGIAERLRPGTICVDMSTVGPAAVRDLAARLGATGAFVLDAPVSGSIALASSAQLTIMVGGAVEQFERALPVLQSMAKHVFHLGPLGAGATMKLAVNTVVYGLNQALAEGLLLAQRAGVDFRSAYDVLETSAVAAPYVHYRRDSFLNPDQTEVGLPLRLAEKDLQLIQHLAQEVKAKMPQVQTNLGSVSSAVQNGKGERDVSGVLEFLEHLSLTSWTN